MTRFLGVLILFFIFSENLLAEDVNYKQSIKLHKDVMTGYKTKWSATHTTLFI